MEKEDRSRHFNRERRGGGEGERERGKIGAIVGGRREFKRASLWIVWFPSRVSVLSRCTRFNASGLFRNSVAAVSPTTNRPSLLSSFPFFVLHQRQGKPVQRNKRKRGECVGFLIRRRSWLPWSKREREREKEWSSFMEGVDLRWTVDSCRRGRNFMPRCASWKNFC